MQKDPPAGPYRLFPLKPKSSAKPTGDSINLARYARGTLSAEHKERFPYGLSGVRVLEIPFLRGTHDYVVLDAACRESVLPLGGETRQLHILYSAEKTTAGAPLFEATIVRGDGKDVKLVWQCDDAGNWTVQGEPRTTTRLGHTGTYARMAGTFPELPEARLMITTWGNDNEWLPLSQVTFKLVDPNAHVFVLGVTGERLEQKSK